MPITNEEERYIQKVSQEMYNHVWEVLNDNLRFGVGTIDRVAVRVADIFKKEIKKVLK